MVNKLKTFFSKPSKIRSITSISITTIAIFSFSGMAIAGSFLNKNYLTISKLIEINKKFDINEDRENVNGVGVGQKNWLQLATFFRDKNKSHNSYWLMFNDNVSPYQYWNNLYQSNELFKIDLNFKDLNKILEKHKNKSDVFSKMINLNTNLNYNLGANNVILPVGICLVIISTIILSLTVVIHITRFKNMKLTPVLQEDDKGKPEIDDEDEILF